MNEEQPELNVYEPPRKTIFEKNAHIIDYATGFVVGVFFSFYMLRLMQNKTRKRKGIFYGCILSFVIILTLSVSFLSYVSYVQRTVQENKKLGKNQRKLSLVSFNTFIHDNVSGFFSLPSFGSDSKRSLLSKSDHHSTKKTEKASKASRKYRSRSSYSKKRGYRSKKRQI